MLEKNIVIRIEKKLSELLELNKKKRKNAITDGGRIGKIQMKESKKTQNKKRCICSMHHNKEYEEKWGDGLVKGVKFSATAGVSRCMFTLY